MAVNRPDVWFGLAMNADPNDAQVSPVWSDWTTGLRKVSGLERGRNFELDQAMASDPSLLIRDVNELLNPANPSSPYADLVLPYRAACLLAQWPNTPVGGAVNLLNANTWRGNTIDRIDPSFDSYTTGAFRPNWLTNVGSVVGAAIDATTPFQGAKDVTYTVGGALTVPQGLSWTVACIPGRQYTASGYVRQTAASTQRISVSDQLLVGDPFAGRTVANGFGTSYSGPAWTVAGGVSGDYAAGGGTARITHNSVNVTREASIPAGTPDQIVFQRFAIPIVPAGGPVVQWTSARRTDFDNQYLAQLSIGTDSSATIALVKRVASVQTTITSAAVGFHRPGDIWNVRLQTLGANQYVWVWRDDQPATLDAVLVGADTALSTGNTAAVTGRRDPGNTDTFTTSILDFYVRGYVHGTTSAAAGAYNRLTVTWIATQPYHTVQMATAGTSVAATVFLDALQHEQGAVASAFTTSGPVIYPVMRSYVEQWPRIWGSAGFEGYVDAPCVDGLAALQAITIGPEYVQAVMDIAPDFYWRLNDGTDTGLFADTSGNGRAALSRYVSKYGAGTDIEPGTAIELPGLAGATGVKFTQAGLLGSSPGTALGTTALALPEMITSAGSWAMSFACWAQTTNAGAGSFQALITIGRGPNPGTILAPMWLEVDTSSNILQLMVAGPGGLATQSTTALAKIFDGNPHHYVASVSVAGGNAALAIWVDGNKFSGTYSIGSWPASTVKSSLVTLGMDTAGLLGFGWNGTISDAALWNRALTDTEVGTLNSAGTYGYNGETTGARIVRHLDLGGYTGPTRISQNAGTALETNLQPPSWPDVKDLLTDSLETAAAEQGMFWVAPDGAVVFESRQDRWLRLTPVFTLGEDTASGEIPYLMEGAKFVPDPLYVYANVQIGRNNGAVAQGGTIADIKIASRRSFPRSVQASFDFYTDDIAQSMANWIFNTHDQAVLRVDELAVDPAANPALWPFALGVEIGQRCTVRRRAKAANSGAGITMSADYFVEKIGIDVINFDSGEWSYRIQLSPINAAPPVGQPTFQPWILGDPTYGVLNSTTVLGW